MSYVYRFKRGDRVKIVSGKYAGATGTVDSKVFQRTVDYPDGLGAGGAHGTIKLTVSRRVSGRWSIEQFSRRD